MRDRFQLPWIKPEQRQRDFLHRRQMKDRSKDHFAPEIGDRFEKALRPKRAFDRIAIEDPVEHSAVAAFEHRVGDGRRAVGRGDAVARDRGSLLDADDRAGDIDGQRHRSPGAGSMLEEHVVIFVAAMGIERAGDHLCAGGFERNSAEEMQAAGQMGDGGVFLSREQIPLAHQTRAAAPVGKGRREMIDAEQFAHAANAADAQPGVAGAHPFGQFQLERASNSCSPTVTRIFRPGNASMSLFRFDARITQAGVREDFENIIRIIHRLRG